VSLPNLMGKASLAVCHGGAGTTLTALENGVPLVIIPQGSPSQARMASACEAAGVGVVVETGASALDIREAVRSALAGKMKAQATVIADEVAEMPPARSVVADLETLAAQGVRGRLG
jgi:UDP:flavonoid glycosyltransferase YjiC (YdhE family)